MEKSEDGTENRIKINDIRTRLQFGYISYDKARNEAQPIIAKMNARGAEISRESGTKYKPLSFAVLMR